MATVREIAAAAEVSPSTVSRVLNGGPNVRCEVRQKVIAAARQMNVFPARQNLVLIIPERPYLTGYCGCMLTALLTQAGQRQISVEIIPSSDLSVLDGMLLSGAISLVYDNGIEKLWAKTQSLPLVCVNTASRHRDNIFSVHSDNAQGIRLALDYLHHFGHRKLALLDCSDVPVAGRDNLDWRERHQSFEQWHTQKLPGSSPCLLADGSPAALRAAMAAGVTAVLAIGEFDGFALLQTCRACGIAVPEELSVIGFEHPQLSAKLSPALTAIGQNFEMLASVAFDMLQKMQCNEWPIGDSLMEYQLFERDTVAPPRH